MSSTVKKKSPNNIHSSFLKDEYLLKIVPALSKRFSIQNPHCVPKLKAIVVSMRFGKDGNDKKAIEAGINELSLISGRLPSKSMAKKSISTFKLRAGQISGAKCTLRRDAMYNFLAGLIYNALPRIKDFRGFSSKSLDNDFNFSFGIKDHLIFPELSYDKIYKARGLDITIVTHGIVNSEQAIALLQGFNFPIT